MKCLIDHDSSRAHLNRQDKEGKTALMHIVQQASNVKKHEVRYPARLRLVDMVVLLRIAALNILDTVVLSHLQCLICARIL